MPDATTTPSRATAQVRSVLCARLGECRAEIEEGVLARVRAISDPTDAADPTYVEGLYGAVSAAVDFGIATIESSTEREPPLPVGLLAQARSAARSGVSLDTVLRRYFAGYSLLGYFMIKEASHDDLMGGAELQSLLAQQAVLFDRLLAAIGEEHARESESLLISRQRRQAERIERLLGGELIDTTGIAYDFDGWHLGAVVTGAESEAAIRGLAEGLDCRLLLCPREEGVLWAWFGARRPLDPAGLLERLAPSIVAQQPIAIGEPGEGLAGWRLSHRQAASALTVAQRKGGAAVRYREVALLASALRDDLLAASLKRLYLEPLEGERDGGAALRETLRAYFAAGRNGAAAGASLGISRQTVNNRLLLAEERIGRSLTAAGAEVETALRLEDLT